MNKVKSYMLFLILLTMLSPATFGMAQTIIVKTLVATQTKMGQLPFQTKQHRYGCLISATRQRASLR